MNTEAISRLKEIIGRLRRECPWDKAQTHDSLKPYLMEETFELLDALDKNQGVVEELGDLLLQIMLHSAIAEEEGRFNLDTVADGLSEKMIRRHPHIFAKTDGIDSPEAVRNQWEQIKKKEKKENSSILDGVPKAMPALQRAYRVGEKCAGVGFDWKNAGDAWKKVEEETQEFQSAKSKEHQVEEFGDLLFALVSFGRLSGINSEDALRSALHKFESRFKAIEPKLAGKTLEEMESLWQSQKLS